MSATTGPLRGTYSRERPFGPKDIHGGVDLDDDGGSDELLVAFDSNSPLAGIARVDGCDLSVLHTDDLQAFEVATEIYGHSCCPYQYASLRCVRTDHGTELVATRAFPLKADGSNLTGFDLTQQMVSDPLDLNYSWSRTQWRVVGDTVRNVASINGTSRGHNLISDMLTSGLDCLGVRTASR